jgi:uncharacterized protein (DUF58 family)
VDVSGSQSFGSGTRPKAELAAEITCLLALSAIKNQDKVGLILFSDRIEKSIPPRKGRTAAMRLVREVLAAEETRRGTDIAAALRFLSQVQKRRAVVFLISDFMARDYERELRVASRRHDVICCRVGDPREHTLPDAGLIEVQDPETEALTRQFRKLRADALFLDTSRPFADEVHKLFRQRQVRAARG